MKQTVKLCAMLFCAMLWLSPAGAQQKTRIATDQVGVTIDKAVPIMARMSVDKDQATADGFKKISADKTVKSMSRSVAKAGGEGADFELRMKNPAQDTVYSETNTPTFEVDVVNGEDLVWGKEPGDKAMKVQIYTEDAYTDPRDGICNQFFVDNPTFTETPALPQGKYHTVFTLLYVSEEGYYDYVLNSAGEKIFTEIDFTIAYGTTNDTMLVMKNPAKDTVYNETNTPTFELSVLNGKDLVWGTAVGNNVVWMQVYAEDSYEDGNPVISEVYTDTVITLSKPLPKGKYRVVFYLVSIAEQQGYVNYVFNTVGWVKTKADFTINYGEVHDPELIVSNPAQDTVYSETNTPTFEVDVVNGEDLVWGEEPGNAVMMVQIYTEEAYNDPNASCKRYFEPSTTFTVKQALPQGKYHTTFNLMTVAEGGGYYYVRNVAGENIATEVGFTIAYGTTNDTMLVMKNPAKDTVYTKTNTPTFEVSVINGEDLVWGEEVGESIIEMQIYPEQAYNNADVNGWIVKRWLTDTVYTLTQQSLSNGKYRAVFRLASVTQRNDDGSYKYTYLTNATGRVETGVNFTIDYEGPKFSMKNPARDTVYNETNAPTFEVSLINGEDFVWGNEHGNYIMYVEIYTEESYNANGEPFIDEKLADTVYTLSRPLPQGKYHAVFNLMTVHQEGSLYYTFVYNTEGVVRAEVNFTINYGDVRYPALILLNPAKDTVYTETNTPTFEVSVENGEDFVWGNEHGNYMMYVEIYTEESYNTNGYSYAQQIFTDTVCTFRQPLPQGKYRAIFWLMEVVERDGYNSYEYVTNLFGRITTETAFTINYDGPDLELRMKNPAKDTVYTQTNTPTFELSVIGGESVVLGNELNKNVVEMKIYTEEAYNAGGYEMFYEILTDTVYALSQKLPQGEYRAVFTLRCVGNGYYYDMVNAAGNVVKTGVKFTIEYAEPEPELRMKNPARDTIYTETNTPTFEVAVLNGEDLVWGEEPGNNAVVMTILDVRGYGIYSQASTDGFFTVEDYLSRGRYRAVFNLIKYEETEDGYLTSSYVTNIAGKNIAVETGFSIDDGTPDPEFRMKNPARDTVYTETNTPTFEVSVLNGKDLSWGEEGDNVMQVQLYTEEAYNDPQGRPKEYLVYDTTFTVAQALPQGKYHAVFTLLEVSRYQEEVYQDFVYNLAGKRITAETGFTIAYGVTKDTMLVMKNPTKDTVYNETNVPTFELSVINGQDLVWGEGTGNNKMLVQIYTEAAYNAHGEAIIQEYLADTVFMVSQPLPKGNYRAVFNLMFLNEEGYYADVYNTMGVVKAGVAFTINYADPELRMKKPSRDTTYTKTNIPAFELSVKNGENLVWGKEPGKNVVRMDIYNLANGSLVVQEYLAGTVFNLSESLPKGRYSAGFYLMTVGTQADSYDYVTTLAGENITTGTYFTISYADPEFRMKNPARDTVYAETNTPTFEVSVTNGESFIWGKKRGNKVMKVEIYTEEAYNDPQGQPKQFFVENTTFTVPQALAQGKYHAVFTLMSVGTQADSYDYVTTIAGEKVSAETGFTIAYGITKDTMLVMKNPANDTVYNETNQPTFAVSVINGKDLVWGTTAGKNVVKMQVYTEAAYNAKGEPFVQEYVADTVFALPQLLPKGEYRAVFNLMSVAEQEGYNYVYNALGEIKAAVKFTINYGDIHNPALTLLNPSNDTVYEIATPTFVLSLDKGGHDITLSQGAGNAAIRIEIFKAGATESLFEDFFVATTYKLAGANALDTGNYNVRFTLMQWADGSTQPNYWPATERVATQVNIRIAKSEIPEPVAMVAPTDLSTRTQQDTVWFSWTSKEKVYQLQVTDAFGEMVQNLKEDAASEGTVTTVWVSKFAEGTYKWRLRAVAESEGAVVDSSDWVEGEKFTVKYETPGLSVEDNILAEVNVYPNPTMGEFKVNVPVDAVVEIYAANGHRVAARRVVAGTETFALETSGMYFVRVTANGKTAVRRIVVR